MMICNIYAEKLYADIHNNVNEYVYRQTNQHTQRQLYRASHMIHNHDFKT